MEVLATPVPNRPQRSLSYNDLKRRRLQRSASHKKMTLPQHTPQPPRRRHLTEHKSLVNQVPKDEKTIEGVIYELKGVLGDIRRKKSEKRFFSIRDSLTQRSQVKQNVQQTVRKVDNLWANVEEGGQTKRLIRLLLNKNKSQRKMKFNEVRDKLKMEKQKSRSGGKQKIVKQIVSPLKEKLTESPIKQIFARKKKQYLRKTQEQTKETPLDRSLEQLTNCPLEMKNERWKKQFDGKQNNQKMIPIMDMTQISEIRGSEQPEDITNSNPFNEEKTRIEGSFLKLLEHPEVLEMKVCSRQGRRKSEIDRIRRVFPQGFFAN